MAQIGKHKKDKSRHYGFLVSWSQNEAKKAHVKGETKIEKIKVSASGRHAKKADSLAQAEAVSHTKKDILRSLILISLILILELVVYLAWNRFFAR